MQKVNSPTPEQLIGKRVKHFAFGTGRVTQTRGDYIVVCFGGVERMFEYPAAFGEYLTIQDKRLQKQLPVCTHDPVQSVRPAVRRRKRGYVHDEYDTAALADTVRLKRCQ